jgi:hypothetical protein
MEAARAVEHQLVNLGHVGKSYALTMPETRIPMWESRERPS